MIKILHILEATLGGTRRHVIDLLRLIDLHQFEVTFCYSTERADENFFVELEDMKGRGVRCVEIKMHREISIIRDLKSFIDIYKLILKNNFDVIHAHSSKAGFLGRVAAKLVSWKIKTVYTPNSMALNINKMYKYLEKLVTPFTDVIIAVSESEKQEILNAKITKKVISINSGVKTFEKRKPNNSISNELNLHNDKMVVVSIGRLTRQKDPITFFQLAKSMLKSQYENSQFFVWIGDGELRSEVEKFISQNGIQSNCAILGWRTDVDHLLWGADIFILTSIYESFGYVTCEAMAHFLPVIATNVVGTSDIIEHGKTGYLVETGDYHKMAEYVEYLCKNDSVRNEMGLNGSKRVINHFNVNDMVNNTQNIYLQLLGES